MSLKFSPFSNFKKIVKIIEQYCEFFLRILKESEILIYYKTLLPPFFNHLNELSLHGILFLNLALTTFCIYISHNCIKNTMLDPSTELQKIQGDMLNNTMITQSVKSRLWDTLQDKCVKT